jgi:hypothetical protein
MIFPTLIYAILDDLSYKFLLGIIWIHVMRGVPSTLHRMMKFLCNEKVYTIKDDSKYECYLQTKTRYKAPISKYLSN